MKPLRKRMFDALVLRNFPPRTIDAYIEAVAVLARHHRVSPDRLTPGQVRAWLQSQRAVVVGLPFEILVRGLAFFFVEVIGWPIIRKGRPDVPLAPMTPPLMAQVGQRMTEDMKRRNFSPRTIAAYVGAISRFARHFQKCPTELGVDEIRAWQLLLHDRKLSFSTYNVTSCALRFLYGVVLQKPDMTTVVPFARAERKLPTILSQAEVCAMVRAVSADRDRLVVVIAYACGLRVSELASLRSSDVDEARRLLHVHAGKGRKDRLIPLSDSLLSYIGAYQRLHAPGEWLFPGESRGTHVDTRTIQRVVAAAAAATGLVKRVTPHILRHCFATHHLEARTDLRTVQSLLGHGSIGTTIRYHHMSRVVVTATASPADILDLLAATS